MCGIFGLFNCEHFTEFELELIIELFNKGNIRGPDNSNFINCRDYNAFIGFHRLAINGLNKESDQPFWLRNKILLCNGEIYNYKQLYETYDIKPTTDSDCEVIIHLYEKFGFEKMISMLDGVFAFILIDYDDDHDINMYVSRDPFGVRPLYICHENDEDNYNGSFGFTSIMKQVNGDAFTFKQYNPGHWSRYSLDVNTMKWVFLLEKQYFSLDIVPTNNQLDEKNALDIIYSSLCRAVKKRVETTERPIACLLSGGLDSSLITSLVCKYYQTDKRKLETYSIGLKESVDIVYARKVADFLGTNHTEIILSEKEFLSNIPKVIYNIESYDTTTVRASVGNFLVAKYISKHSNAKVIFNGDGSDELTGGYLYFHHAPDNKAFNIECKRLLKDIHYFDVLRSDRCISSNGLEARTPFLDRGFVCNYMSIPVNLRNHNVNNKCEKYLLRKAFSNKNLLPDEVLWRTKEAFSDGVSGQNRSWFNIIQEAVKNKQVETYHNNDYPREYTHNIPVTDEMRYYRSLFDFHYGKSQDTIPYFWMPRFTNATDASARTLDIYNKYGNSESN